MAAVILRPALCLLPRSHTDLGWNLVVGWHVVPVRWQYEGHVVPFILAIDPT